MPTYHAIEMQQHYSPHVDRMLFGNPASSPVQSGMPREPQAETRAPVPEEVANAPLAAGRHAAGYDAAKDGALPHNQGRHAAYQPRHSAGPYALGSESALDSRRDYIPRHSAQPAAPGRHKSGEHKGASLPGRIWSATKNWMMTDPM